MPQLHLGANYRLFLTRPSSTPDKRTHKLPPPLFLPLSLFFSHLFTRINIYYQHRSFFLHDPSSPHLVSTLPRRHIIMMEAPAPLSSPSVSQHQQSYFTKPATNPNPQQPAQTAQTSTYQQQGPAQQTQPSHQQQNNASPFLRDFNLVAEAAKRAQIAVLVRDLEAVGLS